MPDITAGVTLNAVGAIDTQQTFTRAQLAYYLHLAFVSGANAGTTALAREFAAMPDEITESAQVFDDVLGVAVLDVTRPRRIARWTRDQRVRARHQEMLAGMERERRRRAAREQTNPTPAPAAHQPTGVASTRIRMVAGKPVWADDGGPLVPVGDYVDPARCEWPTVAVPGGRRD